MHYVIWTYIRKHIHRHNNMKMVLEINVKGVILQVTQNSCLLVETLSHPNALHDSAVVI